jgi:transposase-like protein
MAFQKQSNTEIAQKLNVERHCIGRWRRRWQLSFDALLAIEMHETHAALRRSVIDVLSDAHRNGRPSKFSNEQLA